MSFKKRKFYLFRVRFIRDHQQDILDDGATPENIFLEAIREKPSTKLPRGAEWKLANLHEIGVDGGCFAVGRISSASMEKFDYDANEFIEQKDHQGPFSLIFYNNKIGFVAIEDKSKVNSKVEATAKRLSDLLSSSSAVRTRNIKCVVDKIVDPEGFIQKIENSTHVLKFRAYFTGPNPIDADEIFQKPLEVYAAETRADRGVVEVSGSNLNKKNLIAITRSNAATGNNVTATLEKDGIVSTIPLKGITANFNAPVEDLVNVFNKMRQRYEQVRHAENRD